MLSHERSPRNDNLLGLVPIPPARSRADASPLLPLPIAAAWIPLRVTGVIAALALDGLTIPLANFARVLIPALSGALSASASLPPPPASVPLSALSSSGTPILRGTAPAKLPGAEDVSGTSNFVYRLLGMATGAGVARAENLEVSFTGLRERLRGSGMLRAARLSFEATLAVASSSSPSARE